ncbi:MAG TPA: hypothetical protein VJ376_18040 [Pseudomonadota bacterium]|nr:hypothetical protein [Pseudomonadota bacterium]
MMKKIAVAAAVLFGLGALAVATPAEAKGFNNAKYIACHKRMASRYSYSPGYVFMVNDCYYGRMGY